MLHRKTKFALATTIALVAGCTTTSAKSSLLSSCEAYTSALSAVSAAAARGRLTDDQIQTVTELTTVINPICSAPPSTEDGATAVLATVRIGLEKLVFFQAQGEQVR